VSLKRGAVNGFNNATKRHWLKKVAKITRVVHVEGNLAAVYSYSRYQRLVIPGSLNAIIKASTISSSVEPFRTDVNARF
jgi:hypothetical protein